MPITPVPSSTYTIKDTIAAACSQAIDMGVGSLALQGFGYASITPFWPAAGVGFVGGAVVSNVAGVVAPNLVKAETTAGYVTRAALSTLSTVVGAVLVGSKIAGGMTVNSALWLALAGVTVNCGIAVVLFVILSLVVGIAAWGNILAPQNRAVA